ncbi:MAG: YCF48-related protein [Polyangiales bacterium]
MSRVVSLALAAGLIAVSARAEPVQLSHRDRLYDATSSAGSLYVVGHPGRLLRSKDGGKTFEPVDAGLKEEALFSIAFNAKGQGAIVGRSGLVLTSEGERWTKSVVKLDDEQPNLFAVDVLPSGTLVAVGEFGAIVRSEDRGKTWSRSSYGIEAPKADCVVEGSSESENSDVVGEARLTDVHFIDEQRGYAVGEFGLILRTEDGGRTFQRQASCTDKLLYGIATVGDGAMAVGADGAVVETKDGGRTWSVLPSGTIEHLFGVYADAKRALIVGAAGTVLARAGGEPLREAESGVHTWLTSAVLDEQGQGLIVGGRASVLRTQDGGKTQTRIFGE